MAETDKTKGKNKENKFWNCTRICFVIGGFAIIIAIWAILCRLLNNNTYDVNALFSALAFGGMLVALWMQNFELGLQRKELEFQHTEMITSNETAIKQWKAMEHQWKEMETSNETAIKQLEAMELQRKEMNEQKDLMDLQKFESAIFNMLGQYSNIISAISGENILGQIVNGHEYTNYWAEVITKHETYNYNNDNIKLPMANYVNYLFQIFKYIDQVNVLNNENLETEYDNRRKYCSIVTSYISYNEMALLKFCIDNNPNYNDFSNLCWDYALYENLRNVGKVVPDHNDALFKPEAAKERWISIIKNNQRLGFPQKRPY